MHHQTEGIKQFVIVTGMSGAGKTTALKFLEDLGFLTIDIRNAELPDDFFKVTEDIRDIMPRVRIMFLDTSDEALIRRFEQTRRRHPLGDNLSIQEGIQRERSLLAPIREKADIVIDTSFMDLHQHRQRLLQEFSNDDENGMSLILSSFGFKYGVPQDSNYVFDVRFLPNPFYVPELKPLTGKDPAVQEFVIPRYLETGKAQLHVAIGCTGGRHRSVACAEWLRIRYENLGGVGIIHRDKDRMQPW